MSRLLKILFISALLVSQFYSAPRISSSILPKLELPPTLHTHTLPFNKFAGHKWKIKQTAAFDCSSADNLHLWCCYSRSSPEVQDESPTAFSSCPSKCLTGTSKLISLKSKVISLPPLKHYSSPSVSCLLRMAFTQQNCQKQFVHPVSPSCLQKGPGIQNPLISCTLNFFLICLFCFLLLLPFNGFFFISDLLPKLSLSKEFCSY